MKGEIYDKKEIYDQLNKDVYFKDGGSINLASLTSSIEKIRSKSKSSSNSSSGDDSSNIYRTQKTYKAEWIPEEIVVRRDPEEGYVEEVKFGEYELKLPIPYDDLRIGDLVEVETASRDITNDIILDNSDGAGNSASDPYLLAPYFENTFGPGSNGAIYIKQIKDLPDDDTKRYKNIIIYTDGWDESNNRPYGMCYVIRLQSFDGKKSAYLDLVNNPAGLDMSNRSGTQVILNSSIFYVREASGVTGAESLLNYVHLFQVANGATFMQTETGLELYEHNNLYNIKTEIYNETGPITIRPDINKIQSYSDDLQSMQISTAVEASRLLGCSVYELNRLIGLMYTHILYEKNGFYEKIPDNNVDIFTDVVENEVVLKIIIGFKDASSIDTNIHVYYVGTTNYGQFIVMKERTSALPTN